jgi:hypothetical protein
MNCAFHLHVSERIGGARGTTAQVSIKGAHFIGRELSVKVTVEFSLP